MAAGAGEFLKDVENFNFKAVEKKVIIGIVSLVGGYFMVSMLIKFVEDNWDFRVKSISNKPVSPPSSNN